MEKWFIYCDMGLKFWNSGHNIFCPMAQKCILCNTKKGWRDCLRFNGIICSSCCGTNRNIAECDASCDYLKPFILKVKAEKGNYPLYKILKTRGEGSHVIVVSREMPNGNIQFVSPLVDVWKMGLKDCAGADNTSKSDFHQMLSFADAERLGYENISLEEALWMVKHGLRIAKEVGTPTPKEFKKFKYILGDMSNVEVRGSLYKCYKCGKGELSSDIVEEIKEVTKHDTKRGICGTPKEIIIYFMCENCKVSEE